MVWLYLILFSHWFRDFSEFSYPQTCVEHKSSLKEVNLSSLVCWLIRLFEFDACKRYTFNTSRNKKEINEKINYSKQ